MKLLTGSIALLLMAACGAPKPAKAVFPESVAGGWQRGAVQDEPAAAAPELVRQFGLKSVRSSVYSGPGSATVTVYEMTNSAAGLEIVQKWRPEADAVVFFHESWFVVIRWKDSPREAVTKFVQAYQAQLRAP